MEEVTYDEYDHSTVVIIRPSVDASELDYMMIVTGYEPYQNGDYQKPEVEPPAQEPEEDFGGGVG